jgi:hypothetical protein
MVELGEVFADPSALVSSFEARLCVVLLHMQHIQSQHLSAINYIEEMLRAQLIGAIGKASSIHTCLPNPSFP